MGALERKCVVYRWREIERENGDNEYCRLRSVEGAIRGEPEEEEYNRGTAENINYSKAVRQKEDFICYGLGLPSGRYIV